MRKQVFKRMVKKFVINNIITTDSELEKFTKLKTFIEEKGFETTIYEYVIYKFIIPSGTTNKFIVDRNKPNRPKPDYYINSYKLEVPQYNCFIYIDGNIAKIGSNYPIKERTKEDDEKFMLSLSSDKNDWIDICDL